MADLLGDKFGRRWSIIFSDCFLIGGAAVLSVSLGSMMLSLGRLIVGYGLGLQMMLGPIFLAECAPLAVRQQIVQWFFFMYFIGLILSYFSGVMFPGQFMYMFAMGAIPSII